MTFVGGDQDHQVVGDRAYRVPVAAGEFEISLRSMPSNRVRRQAACKRRSPAFRRQPCDFLISLIIFRLMTRNRTSCHGRNLRMARVKVVGLGG